MKKSLMIFLVLLLLFPIRGFAASVPLFFLSGERVEFLDYSYFDLLAYRSSTLPGLQALGLWGAPF